MEVILYEGFVIGSSGVASYPTIVVHGMGVVKRLQKIRNVNYGQIVYGLIY